MANLADRSTPFQCRISYAFNYTRPKQAELMVTRTIPASPADVYDVWLDAKSPGGPWHGCNRVILDVKVDG